jgi:hypothetical protein
MLLPEGQTDKAWEPSKNQKFRQKILHSSKLFVGFKHMVHSVTNDFRESRAKFWLQKFE